MNITTLLESLNQLGIEVSTANNDLKIVAPEKLITPGLLQLVKENKRAIIDVLTVNQLKPDNFSISRGSLDYVDYQNSDSNSRLLNPHNPANASKKFDPSTCQIIKACPLAWETESGQCREDFKIAISMFAGHGSRIITSGHVIDNRPI